MLKIWWVSNKADKRTTVFQSTTWAAVANGARIVVFWPIKFERSHDNSLAEFVSQAYEFAPLEYRYCSKLQPLEQSKKSLSCKYAWSKLNMFTIAFALIDNVISNFMRWWIDVKWGWSWHCSSSRKWYTSADSFTTEHIFITYIGRTVFCKINEIRCCTIIFCKICWV